MLDLGEEQEKETWKMERSRSFGCVCLHPGLGPEGPPLCSRTGQGMPLGSEKDRAAAAGCWRRLCSG